MFHLLSNALPWIIDDTVSKLLLMYFNPYIHGIITLCLVFHNLLISDESDSEFILQGLYAQLACLFFIGTYQIFQLTIILIPIFASVGMTFINNFLYITRSNELMEELMDWFIFLDCLSILLFNCVLFFISCYHLLINFSFTNLFTAQIFNAHLPLMNLIMSLGVLYHYDSKHNIESNTLLFERIILLTIPFLTGIIFPSLVAPSIMYTYSIILYCIIIVPLLRDWIESIWLVNVFDRSNTDLNGLTPSLVKRLDARRLNQCVKAYSRHPKENFSWLPAFVQKIAKMPESWVYYGPQSDFKVIHQSTPSDRVYLPDLIRRHHPELENLFLQHLPPLSNHHSFGWIETNRLDYLTLFEHRSKTLKFYSNEPIPIQSPDSKDYSLGPKDYFVLFLEALIRGYLPLIEKLMAHEQGDLLNIPKDFADSKYTERKNKLTGVASFVPNFIEESQLLHPQNYQSQVLLYAMKHGSTPLLILLLKYGFKPDASYPYHIEPCSNTQYESWFYQAQSLILAATYITMNTNLSRFHVNLLDHDSNEQSDLIKSFSNQQQAITIERLLNHKNGPLLLKQFSEKLKEHVMLEFFFNTTERLWKELLLIESKLWGKLFNQPELIPTMTLRIMLFSRWLQCQLESKNQKKSDTSIKQHHFPIKAEDHWISHRVISFLQPKEFYECSNLMLEDDYFANDIADFEKYRSSIV
ncbi:MAG: hypothetical protein CMF42_01700 [Legionellales bacterium]|nr:hypothetical protein [Legionellales bacterium]|tara:strand:+ start:1710 stop:3797 length:2088 start_codon:yes stop_codon:yes gene_type:complete